MHCGNEAIITAAGSSNRIGNFIKKEYFIVNNKPILAYSIEIFLKTARFDGIIVTLPAGDEDKVKQLLSPHIDLSLVQFITGGATRQDSVYNALEAMEKLKPANVLIHDGARPWIDSDLVMRVLRTTEQKGSCIPVIALVDSLVTVDADGCIMENLDRERIKAVQTPQGFAFLRILEAHRQAKLKNIRGTDDSILYRNLFGKVHTVPGNIQNKKITYKSDLKICG